MSGEHSAIIGAWAAIALSGMLFSGMAWHVEESRVARRVFLGFVAYALTGWLIMPWMWYGAKQVFLWNVGHINDLEAPTQVLPPTPVIRPSAADATLEKP